MLCIPFAKAADDPVESVQRTLKTRGFYMGAVNGRFDDETRAALKRFQIREGLAVTGETDIATLQALTGTAPTDLGEAASESMRDRARKVETSDREFLSNLPETERRDEGDPPRQRIGSETPGPNTPAQSSAPSAKPEPDADPKSETEVQRYVENYLKAAEAPQPDEELSFFADRVDYFDSGRVTRDFIRKDQSHYYRRWPQRRFTLLGTPQVKWIDSEKASVRFRIRYELSSVHERASGMTENLMALGVTRDGLRIGEIRERKVRD
jgi:peptidoglycan hydrolase-like protein with peptidoglycan-binding domain